MAAILCPADVYAAFFFGNGHWYKLRHFHCYSNAVALNRICID